MVGKGKSLLPTGIIGVKGDFDPNEAVSCCDKEGLEFARGLTAYSSNDIDKIKGLKTAQIKEVLGYCLYSEVINRDDMVLLR
jgi:glutamate 5-kinase